MKTRQEILKEVTVLLGEMGANYSPSCSTYDMADVILSFLEEQPKESIKLIEYKNEPS